MVGLVGVEWLGCREVGGIGRWVGVVRLMGAKVGESGEVRRSVRLAVLILCGSPIRKETSEEGEVEDGATVHTCRLSARMLGALVGVAIDAMGDEFTPGCCVVRERAVLGNPRRILAW